MEREKLVSVTIALMHTVLCHEHHRNTGITEADERQRLVMIDRLLHSPEVKEWAEQYQPTEAEFEEIQIGLATGFWGRADERRS